MSTPWKKLYFKFEKTLLKQLSTNLPGVAWDRAVLIPILKCIRRKLKDEIPNRKSSL